MKLVEPKLHSKSEGKVSARKSLRKETLNGKENRFRISQSQKSVTKSEVPRFLCSFLPKSASVFFFFLTFIFITIFDAFLCFYIAEEMIGRFLGTYIAGGLLIPTIYSLSGTSMVS